MMVDCLSWFISQGSEGVIKPHKLEGSLAGTGSSSEGWFPDPLLGGRAGEAMGGRVCPWWCGCPGDTWTGGVMCPGTELHGLGTRVGEEKGEGQYPGSMDDRGRGGEEWPRARQIGRAHV